MNHFPKQFIQIAQHHAAKRTKMNEVCRNSNNNFNASNPQLADFIGVLGEMIACLELLKRGVAFWMNALYDEKQLPGPDVIVGNYRIDVKASTTKETLIRAYKLDKAKSSGITHYWIIKLNLNNLTYTQKFYSIEQVKTWDLIEKYNKQVYQKTLL